MAPTAIKAGPVTRICHVCGRSYGLSSFDIHLKQCKKLFLAQEELKPASERRQLPKTPPGIDRVLTNEPGGDIRPTREMVEEINRAAQETFNVHGMEKCENCGRTFNEGRLAIHQKSCRPGHVAKRVDDGAAPRNKKLEVEYGRVTSHDRSTSRAISSSAQASPTSSVDAQSKKSTPLSPSISQGNGIGGSSRPLSGSFATNRSKTAAVHSPLSPAIGESINTDMLRQEIQQSKVDIAPNGSMIALIQAKLEHWEATTLKTLQEIRDLKQIFAQLD